MNIMVKTGRCISCRACEVACARKHNSVSNIKVVTDGVKGAPVFCRHCGLPPCVVSCYRSALEKLEGDVVLLKEEKCTGCGLCIIACPFGALLMENGEKPHKCDLCYNLESEPLCVLTCPSRTLMITEIPEFEKAIRYKAYNLYLRAKTK